ncbi:hypothetical protein ACM9HF_01545 [Colwellia sp. RE-S-Sl-9]
MDEYWLLNVLIQIFITVMIIWLVLKRDKKSFIDNGDTVVIRNTILSRVFNFGVRTVKKSDINKVQLAGRCISIFNNSNNAYDVFTHSESPQKVFNQAKAIFTHAEFIEINS